MSTESSYDETSPTLNLGPCQVCGRRNSGDARFCGGCGQQLVADAEISGAVEAPNVADPLVGRVIADRYRILSLLGRGGMGVVYKIEHVHIGKLMAMKLLHGELARDRDTVKRFRREAEAVSRLNHPNTVQVFDFGRSEGLMYLVMEFVDGDDFGQLIRGKGALDFKRVARICAQVCASVDEAHEAGIIHRDLKPENVMITEVPGQSERAKVLDFGLAKLRDNTGNVTVTRAGSIVGTPYYMSPEQIRGDDVDPRGDVYAIGAMIYKACAGVPPFAAPTPMGVLTKHLTDPVIPPSEKSQRHLPPAADRIVLKAMQKDPDERHQSAGELRDELLEFLVSIGEKVDELGFKSQAGVKTAGPSQGEVLATRKDLDSYERRLRTRGALMTAFLVVLLAGVGVGAFYLWQEHAPQVATLTHELEPNDMPDQAQVLPPDTPVRGFIGRRQSEEYGDSDVYAIANPGGERRVLEVSLSGVPNIDTVIDVVRAGHANPVLTADTGPEGFAEGVANFPIRGPDYYLRVRERWVRGQLPVENISDEYVIEWRFVEPGPDEEVEVNDSLELATPIAVGAARSGYIGWGGDVDHYCLSADSERVVADLSGVERLDLVLRLVDRRQARSFTIDENDVGDGERSAAHGGHADRTCYAISVDDTASGGRRSNTDALYTLTLSAPDAE